MAERNHKLTNQEKKVLQAIYDGKDVAKIASDLNVSNGRVYQILFYACHKVGVPGDHHKAARKAAKERLI